LPCNCAKIARIGTMIFLVRISARRPASGLSSAFPRQGRIAN